MLPTFHGTSIGNHDLKIVDYMDIEMGFLRNASMNEIMSATTINENDDLPIFFMYPISLRVWGEEKLASEFNEMTGSTSGGSDGIVIGIGSRRSTS
jgi:hypothetical protein